MRPGPGCSTLGVCHGARVAYSSAHSLKAKAHGHAQRVRAQLFRTSRAMVSTNVSGLVGTVVGTAVVAMVHANPSAMVIALGNAYVGAAVGINIDTRVGTTVATMGGALAGIPFATIVGAMVGTWVGILVGVGSVAIVHATANAMVASMNSCKYWQILAPVVAEPPSDHLINESLKKIFKLEMEGFAFPRDHLINAFLMEFLHLGPWCVPKTAVRAVLMYQFQGVAVVCVLHGPVAYIRLLARAQVHAFFGYISFNESLFVQKFMYRNRP